jgi:hypothetical protein
LSGDYLEIGVALVFDGARLGTRSSEEVECLSQHLALSVAVACCGINTAEKTLPSLKTLLIYSYLLILTLQGKSVTEQVTNIYSRLLLFTYGYSHGCTVRYEF